MGAGMSLADSAVGRAWAGSRRTSSGKLDERSVLWRYTT